MIEFSLESKYLQEEGTIILSGVQALVRLPLDQQRADRRAGLHTATLISGYRGSPLGGLDILLQRNKKLLDAHNVVFMPGVNEDLGATAVFGSQLANLMPNPKYDGVLGMWYGKAPGVDRSGDAFKHANFAGVGRYGGVLALAGDDPVSKSSTLPSHSEVALYDAQMPILYPGNVQEVIELGRYGFELSRYSGAWVGFKVTTNVADAFSTAEVHPITSILRPEFRFNGRPWQPTQNVVLIAPYSLQLEREIHEGRLEAAKLFAAANGLNRITVSGVGDWLGIVAAGKTYYDVREALYQLGLDDDQLRHYGIRLLKIGLLYPLEPEIIKTFARGLEEIFVIEEKRGFIELFLRDVLYNQSERPQVVGKRDEQGRFLVRGDGELDADQITELLARRLTKKVPSALFEKRLEILRRQPIPLNGAGSRTLARTPYFCSGCPHNRSTVVPEGSFVGGGIGCHGLALLMDRNTQGITHMGGEGVQWVGAAPFTNTPHMFQNLGDGTLFHSGHLAIRQAVAAGTNITYKILYNSAVAMTGGQTAEGGMPVPELTRVLEAEGVRKIIVCTHDLNKYPAEARWASGVEIWDRDRLDEAQRKLREEKGVTVLIYDQPCAANLRRKRKRGLVEEPSLRVFINEAVCEGCGDCGRKSNCLSVLPVETEFGRKTQIHQSSCNKDYTCLQGDCPAFLTVIPGQHNSINKQPEVPVEDGELPEPHRLFPKEANLYMMGIGGTGVVTINEILATAALLEGKRVCSLDQTGLSQKGGPVLSHLKILDRPQDISNKVGLGTADAYIVFDLLSGATDDNLRHAHKEKTVAVVSSSLVATGAMVRSTATHFPEGDLLRQRIEAHTRADRNVYLDAIALAENLLGNHLFANMITVGAAYQAGLLPLTAQAVERAIALNGASVEANQQAFRVGRKVVANPYWKPLHGMNRPGAQRIAPKPTPEAQTLIDAVGAQGELRGLLEVCVPELIAYQNTTYAKQYVDFVKRVKEKEADITRDTRLSQGVARYLFKLMAYKDEYEVARLQLRPEFQSALRKQFGDGAKVTYHLHPPFLRALGLKRKIGLGKWFNAGYWLLTKLKGLRGTPFDIFGYAHVRKVERQLIAEYRTLIEQELRALTPATYERAVTIAQLPDMIRGYEGIKLNNVAKFRAEVQKIRTPSLEPRPSSSSHLQTTPL